MTDLELLYANPTVLQNRIILDLETAGGGIIPSANTVTSVLIEHMSRNTSGVTNALISALSKDNPNRITNMTDMHKHMSDYDYIGIYGDPAETIIEFIISEQDLINNSEEVGDGKYSTILPKHTKFDIKGVPFITTIDININTIGNAGDNAGINSLSVQYVKGDSIFNSDERNIEYQRYTLEASDISVVSIFIPVIQLSVSKLDVPIHVETGLSKTIPFDDQLYIVRIYTNSTHSMIDPDRSYLDDKGERWAELHQTLDSESYDPSTTSTPTAIVRPDIVNGFATIDIPQCYFTNNQMGDMLKVEMFTTKGAIDIGFQDLTDKVIVAEFVNTNSAVFTKSDIWIQATVDRIVGGKNGLSFAELKARVLGYIDTESLVVSPDEVASLFTTNGYAVTRFKTGLTDRIYLAHNTLKYEGAVVGAGMFTTTLIPSEFDGTDIKTFLYPTRSWVIPPETIFEYDEVSGTSVPVKGDALPILQNRSDYSAEERANALNSKTYTQGLFHTVIVNLDGVYLSNTYNFQDLKLRKHLATEIDTIIGKHIFIHSLGISHHVPGQYDTWFSLNGNVNFYKVNVKMTIKKEDGGYIVFESPEQLIEEGTVGLEVNIPLYTDYNISHLGGINLSTSANFDEVSMVPLDSLVDVTVSGEEVDVAGKIISASYKIQLKLGSIIDEVFNRTTVSAQPQQYAIHDTHVPSQYLSTRFVRRMDQFEPAPEDVGSTLAIYNPITAKLTPLYLEGQILYSGMNMDGPIIHSGAITVTVDEAFRSLNPDALLVVAYDSLNAPAYTDCIIIERDALTKLTTKIALRTGYLDVSHDGQVLEVILPQYRYVKDSIRFDSNGDPVVEVSRQLKLTVDIPQIGISNFYTVVDSAVFAEGIRSTFLGYCNDVISIKPRLLPGTDIYYWPTRTIGKDASATETNLELSMKFRIFLTAGTVYNSNVEKSIRAKLLTIINDHIINTETVSQISISELLKAAYPFVIDSIDNLGINGDPTIQSVFKTNAEVSFSIKTKIEVNGYGALEKVEDIDVEFIKKEF